MLEEELWTRSPGGATWEEYSRGGILEETDEESALLCTRIALPAKSGPNARRLTVNFVPDVPTSLLEATCQRGKETSTVRQILQNISRPMEGGCTKHNLVTTRVEDRRFDEACRSWQYPDRGKDKKGMKSKY